jgi:hypothetical protein
MSLRRTASKTATPGRPEQGLGHAPAGKATAMSEYRSDLAKSTLSVLSIAVLIGSTLWILRPPHRRQCR